MFSISPHSTRPLSAVVLLIAMAGCSRNSAGPDESAGAGSADSAEFNEQSTPPPASSDGTQSTNTSPFLGGGSRRSTTGEDRESPTSAKRPAKPRTSLEGRWDVVLHGFDSNIVTMLIEATRTDDGYQFKQMGDSPLGWSLSASQVQDNVVDLTMTDTAGRELRFRGTFRDGKVQGNMMIASQGVDLASLEPTTRESLGADVIREPAPGFERIRSLPQDENALKNLAQIAEETGATPLAYQIYRRLFHIVRSQPQLQFDLAAPIDNYVAAAQPWGERVSSRVHLDVGYTLAFLRQSPEQALEHLEQAAEGLRGEADDALLSQLEVSRGLALLDLSDEQRHQEGLTILRKAREENSYNLLAILRLADYHTQQGELQPALELHAELVALPSIPGDMATVERLWGELGNDPQELDAHLNDVYEHLVYKFVEEDKDVPDPPPPIENQQVVLGELFTGAACSPCVAADIATGALEQTYPDSRFLMLRYHQHVPGPDPLTVADGEDRGQYYAIRGTPYCYFNGSHVQDVGGMFFNSPALYDSLRSVLTPLLEQTSELDIELAAAVEGESIHLRARVDGAETYPASWRLRLCLVEELVKYAAPNGIRLHEMVVRTMPGGAEGIVAEDGSLSYEADIPLTDIHEAIRDGIDSAQKKSGSPLPDLAENLGPLHLVAFVQDDASFEILQAASTPVTGSDDLPAPASEQTSDAQLTPDQEQANPTSEDEDPQE